MIKLIESERQHVDVEGKHSVIVTFDDGTEDTFNGFRKVLPEEIGTDIPEGFSALAIVQHGGIMDHYWLVSAWPETCAYGLGNLHPGEG